MSDRIEWISYKGKKILQLDYSELKSDEVVVFLKEVEDFYASNIISAGKKDILILSNVTNARVFGDALNETKRVVKKLRPYSKKSAMVGLSPAKAVLLGTINFFAGESKASKQFKTFDEAKDYLVS